MIKGVYDAAKSMHNKMRNIEIIANNLANINSTGFKREIPFAEFLEEQQGPEKLTQLTDFSPGNLVKTANPFDMAIEGNGFFMVETERGIELTKGGHFTISDEGDMVDQDGNKILTSNGKLNLEETLFEKDNPLKINKNGEILIGDSIVGQLSIAKITDQKGMIRTEGQRFYFENGEHVKAEEGEYTVRQGFLEDSNSNPIMEMQQMIKLNKEYETASRVVRSLDQIMAKAKEIGRV